MKVGLKELRITTKLRRNKMGIKLEAKKFEVICNLGINKQYTIPALTKETYLRSILERLFFIKDDDGTFIPPPQAKPRIFQKKLTIIRNEIITAARVLLNCMFATVMTGKQFLDSTPKHKFKVYERPYTLLGDMFCVFKRSFIGMFVKSEKTDAEKDWIARLVSPRHPEYNYSLGRYLRPMEHVLYQAIDKTWDKCHIGTKAVMKGLNARQTAYCIKQKWDTYKQPVAIGLDMSRFDQHIGKDALQFEHTFYNLLTAPSDRHQLDTLLSWQLIGNYFLRTNDGIDMRFRRQGTRCSGDMNTALGNVLIMCSLLRGLKDHLSSHTMDIIDNGDDCVILIEYEELVKFSKPKIVKYMLQFGFTVKVEKPVYTLEHVTFCQSNPVIDITGDYIMCRNPFTAIAKDCINVHPTKNSNERMKWFGAVAQSGLSLCSGMPVFTSFYTKLLSMSNGKKGNGRMYNLDETGFFHMTKGLKHQSGTISSQTRYSFYQAFGMIPEEQIRLEIIYENMEYVSNTGAPGLAHTHQVLLTKKNESFST